MFVRRGRDVLDVGFGVHIVVLRLFVGGCLRRSQQQERIVVDSIIEVLCCSPSGVREGIRGDSRRTVERNRNVTFVSCDRAGHPAAKWTILNLEKDTDGFGK